MRVLLLSSSARGHAIAEALVRSRTPVEIISICTTANPGIRRIAREQHVLSLMDFRQILAIVKGTAPDFAFIGPDEPIGAGIADLLEEEGIRTVAPKKMLARIESSKGFARELLQKHGIDASPKFRVFSRGENSLPDRTQEEKELNTFIDQDLGGDYVVKYDGLKGGKGVKVSGEHLSSREEGIQYALECLDECGRVVIEEKLIGVEFSLMSFVSGTSVVDMPAVQDHKRACEGDTGPNTGGMGTYSDADHSLPFLSARDLERASEINRQTAAALLRECGEPYRGILYGGFMAVKDSIRLIEYNARFGDPEALNVLPLLASDFIDICLSILEGSLRSDLVSFEKQATVCKYIVPLSYPERKDERGKEVFIPASLPPGVRVYFGDIGEDEQGKLRLGGSRAAGIVGIGRSIAEAEQLAASVCGRVQGPIRFRKDIGTHALVQRRVEMLQQLRE